jgi:hypothetical protein
MRPLRAHHPQDYERGSGGNWLSGRLRLRGAFQAGCLIFSKCVAVDDRG